MESSVGGIFEVFFKLFIVLLIVFLAYISTRFIGKRYMKTLKGKNISVIESVSIGFDKILYLVKVGNQFFLISSSGKNINILSEIKPSNIKLTNDIKQVNKENKLDINNFAGYLSLFKNKFSSQQKAEHVVEKNDLNKNNENDETEHVEENVEKLRNIFNSIRVSDKDKDGVE